MIALDDQLKNLQNQLADSGTSDSLIPPPNVLELQDLRKKLNEILHKAMDDANWLETSMKSLEKSRKTMDKLTYKVGELAPSIHKFKRRPQNKLMHYMMEYNWDLGILADKMKKREDILGQFADKNQDIRMEQGFEIGREFSAQQSILEEYKKTIKILQDQHKGVMFEATHKPEIGSQMITEQGPVRELERIMDEIAELLAETVQKINDNNVNLRTQRLGCFLILYDISSQRDEIVDAVQIPMPAKPNVEELSSTTRRHPDSSPDDNKSHHREDEEENMHSDFSEDDQGKGALVKLSELRQEQRDQYTINHVQKLAGLTNYDETVRLHLALNRVRATLGSVSPLHYSVVSTQYLCPQIDKARKELRKLLKSYQKFKPIKTDTAIDDEVMNYEMQFVQDLAADYHKVNGEKERSFVIEENIKLIQQALAHLDKMEKTDLKCTELRHLKETYAHFVDDNLPRPPSLYTDDGSGSSYDESVNSENKEKKAILTTKKKQYRTSNVKRFVGLNNEDTAENKETLKRMVSEIENELFRLRAAVMPFAFNLIYQEGISFDPFPGDFERLKRYQYQQRDMTDDVAGLKEEELLLNEREYAEMSRDEQVRLIKELMVLEWQYAGWINDREDYVMQKALYREEALYYKRLFLLPLDDFSLERERANLFDSAMTGTMRAYTEGIYERKRAEQDAAKELEEQRMRMKMAGNQKEKNDGFADGGMRMKYDDMKDPETPMGLSDAAMRMQRNGDQEEDGDNANGFSEQRMMIGNKEKWNAVRKVEKLAASKSKIHREHGLGYEENGGQPSHSKDGDDDHSEHDEEEEQRQRGRKIKSSRNVPPRSSRKKRKRGQQEVYESDGYKSSDPGYVSVESEQAQQPSPHRKRNTEHNVEDDDSLPGAHGMDMEMDEAQPAVVMHPKYLFDLEAGDLFDVHHSPEPVLMQNHPMMSEYIEQQVELQKTQLIETTVQQMVEERLREEQQQREMEQARHRDSFQLETLAVQQSRNYMVDGHTSTDGGETQEMDSDDDDDSGLLRPQQMYASQPMMDDESVDGENEYVIGQLMGILRAHQLIDDDHDPNDDVDGLLKEVDRVCREADDFSNKYMDCAQRNKSLRAERTNLEYRLQDVENQYADLTEEHDQLRQEYDKLRAENAELIRKMKQLQRRQGHHTPTAGGPGHESDGGEDMEERDILEQLQDDLRALRQGITDSTQSAEAEFVDCRSRLESMCEPMSDLANDFQSEVLKDAVSKLNKSVADIERLEADGIYQHRPLAAIVDTNIDEIEDLLSAMHQKRNPSAKTQRVGGAKEETPLCGAEADRDMLFPQFVYDKDDGKNAHDDDDAEPGTAHHHNGSNHNDGYHPNGDVMEPTKQTPGGRMLEFDADFPFVKRIEIDGNWFNKKPRAVIEWEGKEFKRKMADFKWLWRMLLLNSSIDRVVPDYPNDIPESMWPEGYLRRRKRELNLFLMQCHSLPWIHNYSVYGSVFLEIDKKEWKRKRNEFDQRIMTRIKQNGMSASTYLQDEEVEDAGPDADGHSGDELEREEERAGGDHQNYQNQQYYDDEDDDGMRIDRKSNFTPKSLLFPD